MRTTKPTKISILRSHDISFLPSDMSINFAVGAANFPLLEDRSPVMTRYFFQADYHGFRTVDNVGEDFSTLQEAKAHAAIVANELSRNDSQTVVVSVLSEDGMLIASAAKD